MWEFQKLQLLFLAVVVCLSASLIAFDDSGEVRWLLALPGQRFTSPALINDSAG